MGPHLEEAAILAAVTAAEEDGRYARRFPGHSPSPWAISGRRAMMANRISRSTRS
jgi:hypothetical protein